MGRNAGHVTSGGVVTGVDAAPGRLADDYFFISQDDRSGRGRLAGPVQSIGLAAALLGELVLAGYLNVVGNEVFPLTTWVPPEPLAAEVMQVLTSRPDERDLGLWLTFLAAEAVDDVGSRMARDNLVVRTERRRLRGVRVEYLPVDLSVAAWPAIRLANLLSSGSAMEAGDVVLTGLAEATGLLGHVLWDGDVHRAGYENAALLLPQLPPQLTALLARTRVAVGDVVLTKRG
jgi:hypothetical protein